MTYLRALPKLFVVQAKLYLREPIAAFFTLLFAPLLLVLMGFIFGNEPRPEMGGKGYLDVYLPAYAAIVIAIVGLIGMPIETTNRRELGVLRRFRATPLRPFVYIVSEVLVYFAMTILGILLLFLLGTTVYRVPFEGNALAMTAGIILSIAAFLAMGYVLVSLAPSPRAVTVIGNILLYIMVYLSGGTVPLEVMPEAVQNVTRFIPLTYVVNLLKGLWVGETLADHLLDIAVLAGITVVGTIIAVLFFRWE